MDYEKIYRELCDSRKHRGVTREFGYEVHHILPKCMGGTDDEDNLVKFTYKEHLLAHKLLVKFSNDVYRVPLIAAVNILKRSYKHKPLTEDELIELEGSHSDLMSEVPRLAYMKMLPKYREWKPTLISNRVAKENKGIHNKKQVKDLISKLNIRDSKPNMLAISRFLMAIKVDVVMRGRDCAATFTTYNRNKKIIKTLIDKLGESGYITILAKERKCLPIVFQIDKSFYDLIKELPITRDTYSFGATKELTKTSRFLCKENPDLFFLSISVTNIKFYPKDMEKLEDYNEEFLKTFAENLNYFESKKFKNIVDNKLKRIGL